MTVVTDGASVVASPLLEPPQIGLIATLANLGGVGQTNAYLDPPEFIDEDGHPQRWETGLRYLPEQFCLQGGVTDPCSVTSMSIPASPDVVKAMPGLVWSGDVCSTFGWKAHDYKGRAIRALLAAESKQIAKELWLGTQAKASGWPNHYLASSTTDVISNGPMSPANALACLEQALADCSNGQRGVIHCTREMGAALSELGNTFRSVNGNIVSYLNTLIIPDAGYDGTGVNGEPAVAGSQWAYGTLIPTVRRGEIQVIPDTFAEATIRGTNLIEWRAERLVAVTWPWCCQVAVEISLPHCATLAS